MIKDLKTNSKERLIKNELIHKYEYHDELTREEAFNLHNELINNIGNTWLKKYFNKNDSSKNRTSEIYSMIIFPLAYPSIRLIEGNLKKMKSFFWKNRVRPHIEHIYKYSLSVGRVLKKNKMGKFVPLASGFLIHKNYFLTITTPFLKRKNIDLLSAEKTTYWVDFENNKTIPPEKQLFEVGDFHFSQESIDKQLILLKLNKQTTSSSTIPTPLPIIKKYENPGIVIAIGYPLQLDKRKNRVLSQYAVFGSPWQMRVKRIAPGHILDDQLRAYHDCTLGVGSEGSPILDLKTGRVIGIHIGNKSKSNMQIIDALSLAKIFNLKYP